MTTTPYGSVERWCSRCRRTAPPALIVHRGVCEDCRRAADALHYHFHPEQYRHRHSRYRRRHVEARVAA
jgi:hypothetical protein